MGDIRQQHKALTCFNVSFQKSKKPPKESKPQQLDSKKKTTTQPTSDIFDSLLCVICGDRSSGRQQIRRIDIILFRYVAASPIESSFLFERACISPI